MFRKKTSSGPHRAGVISMILVALFARCGVGQAADAAAATQYAIQQPSRPVAELLQSVARETGTSVPPPSTPRATTRRR